MKLRISTLGVILYLQLIGKSRGNSIFVIAGTTLPEYTNGGRYGNLMDGSYGEKEIIGKVGSSLD